MKLYAGAGIGTIRFPKAFFPSEGFSGVHDEPAARILLLDAGEKLALVSLELVMLPPELIEQVQKAVESITQFPANHVWVHTAHVITTPHAPHAPIGPGGTALPLTQEQRLNLEGKSQIYRDALLEAVAHAARSAKLALTPARIGWGECRCGAAVNRDIETPFGYWIGENPQGLTNDIWRILRLEAPTGGTIAAVLNGDWKPCTIDNSQMEQGLRQVCSDASGIACRLAEAAVGAPCLFFMGAAGDQIPKEHTLSDRVDADGNVYTQDLGVEAGLDMVTRLGREIADAVISVLPEIPCTEINGILAVREHAFTWPLKARTELKPRTKYEYTQEGEGSISLQTAVLGGIAMVGLKPEINCITGIQLRDASPYEKTMIFSMVNGGQKYMPDLESYSRITWEAQNSMLMPGAAEAFVRKASAQLEKIKEECSNAGDME